MISHPPQIPSFEIRHGVRLRFVTNAAISIGITYQNLLDTILFAASATTGFDVFASVKVRRIQVWSLPAVGGASTVSVEFSGLTAGSTGDNKLHTDTSMGIQPAYVSAKPSMKSLASNYQIASNAGAFSLVCPTGSVIDAELSFVGQYVSSTAAQNALVGATAGSTYLRGLDGKAAATTNIPPSNSIYEI